MHISIRRGVAMALFGNLLSATAFAQQSPANATPKPHEHEALEEVLVTANPLNRSSTDLSQSATVLEGAALRQQLANSLGETLARMPGLANASFGENVGRPVIRGLQGTRVGILNNSLAVSDASSVSQDHAVSIEPFLADQIEVLRGPSTLLFGSGAIGGVVNMVSPTIPQEIPEAGYSGRVTAQGNTAADEEFAAGRLELGQGAFALHLDGFHRRTDDYDIPGAGQLYAETGHEQEHDDEENAEEQLENGGGTLTNSFLKNEGATGGFSWIGAPGSPIPNTDRTTAFPVARMSTPRKKSTVTGIRRAATMRARSMVRKTWLSACARSVRKRKWSGGTHCQALNCSHCGLRTPVMSIPS